MNEIYDERKRLNKKITWGHLMEMVVGSFKILLKLNRFIAFKYERAIYLEIYIFLNLFRNEAET